MLRSSFWKTLATILSCYVLLLATARADDPSTKYREAALKSWAKEMERLDGLNASEKDPDNAVLFIGSSSIRLWSSIAEDMKPWPVIQRGYGGAKFSDLAVLADQVIKPHKFRALAIFVGNDVTGKEDDKTPEEVVSLFKHVVSVARGYQPDAPIFLIEITPTPKRWAAWTKIQAVNAALKSACEQGKTCTSSRRTTST